MKLLLLGSTGLLGQAVAAEGERRGWTVCRAARRGAERVIDICVDRDLLGLLNEVAPDLVVNCAALVDIARCEEDPGLAYAVNARPLASIAEWSYATGRRLLHVSTDHFFPEGGPQPHREEEQVRFVNEYARSKFAGEAFALAAVNSLVLRTSIVGIRGWARLTFAEWAIAALLEGRPLALFNDAFTSSIDVGGFAVAALDLAVGPSIGLLNVAAREVYSKESFVRELGRQLGCELVSPTIGSVAGLTPPRASSLGLDVARAERQLGYKLPELPEVVSAVLKQYRERTSA